MAMTGDQMFDALYKLRIIIDTVVQVVSIDIDRADGLLCHRSTDVAVVLAAMELDGVAAFSQNTVVNIEHGLSP